MFAPGTRVGPYEVLSPLGAGGMGEVYRAKDLKLGREVAIKILPELFASDADRLARFQREAQVLASLNHPNIAAIYGLEESGGAKALVLELVPGETLSDRISRGPIPLDEALPIAKQIAEALEAAHEQGIIHRDLKPANIKITPDGVVKVLDFGLAKLAQPPAGGSLSSVSMSPTITSPARMTGIGVLLGTAPYMSPEQATGRDADKRSDLWAFGCVLYEMLTGRRAFEGEDVADTLASVLKGEVNWGALPPDTPSTLVVLLRGCLARNRQHRVADVAAVLFALSPEVTLTTRSDRKDRRNGITRIVLIAVTITVVAFVAALLAYRLRPGVAAPVTWSEIGIAPAQFSGLGRHVIALAPDGSRIAYVANNALYLRALDSPEPVQVRGSASGQYGREPFFSPDSQWLGFWQEGKLRRVSVNGGTPADIADANNPFGASWESDNSILYAEALQGIYRVSADGGQPQLIVESRGGLVHGPHLLPDSRTVLFTLAPADTASWDDAQIVAESLDTHQRKVLQRGATDGRYLPSGHLVYVSGGTLFAVRFDPSSLTTSGAPVQLVEGVAQSVAQTGAAQFAVSSSGLLAYVPRVSFVNPTTTSTLVMVDQNGKARDLNAPPKDYVYPRVSPEGTQIAVAIGAEGNHIWLWPLKGERLRPLTVGTGPQGYPLWTPDGARIVFNWSVPGQEELWWQPADGTGKPERVTPAEKTRPQLPMSFNRDGTLLIVREPSEGSLWTVSMDATRRVQKLVAQPNASLHNAAVSPDDRWLAYQADTAGRSEIIVSPFPDVDSGRWRISAGSQPAWSSDGDELYFVDSSGAMMHVAVPLGKTWPAAGSPTKLFDGAFRWSIRSSTGRQYDVTRDGKFVMLKPVADTEVPARLAKIVVVQNWLSELRRLVPKN